MLFKIMCIFFNQYMFQVLIVHHSEKIKFIVEFLLNPVHDFPELFKFDPQNFALD